MQAAAVNHKPVGLWHLVSSNIHRAQDARGALDERRELAHTHCRKFARPPNLRETALDSATATPPRTRSSMADMDIEAAAGPEEERGAEPHVRTLNNDSVVEGALA